MELGSGEVRHYAGVVVANGHHWAKRYPDYPGEFTGKQLHSKHYRRPSDLEGERVLVVGAGNSACDIAVEAAQARGPCDISMRRGNWFLPKTILGIPTAEWDRPWLPVWVQRRFFKLMLRLRFGSWARYGLPDPDHRPFDKHPIVNDQLLYYLRHGVVRARPGIERLDGRTVHFVDGTARRATTRSSGGPALTSPSRSSITTCSRGRTACRCGSRACSRLVSPTSTSSGCFSLGAAPGR